LGRHAFGAGVWRPDPGQYRTIKLVASTTNSGFKNPGCGDRARNEVSNFNAARESRRILSFEETRDDL
jgi:hypothetical protein